MVDTGRGYAVGDVDILLGLTGVYVKDTGDPSWRPVPPSAFTPPLNIALASWMQDVHAIPGTSIAYLSWRDDYRSLVYKTFDYGKTWFNISPINPILYGIRYAITFRDAQVGMIVGEGPGRVHLTEDGGSNWHSHSLAVSEPLTDVKYSGMFWNVAGGQNSYWRYNTLTQRWINLSFTHLAELFPNAIKMSFVDDNVVYMTGYNQNNDNIVMFADDGGRNWAPVFQQPPLRKTVLGHKGIHFFDSLKGWVASAHDEFAYTSDGGRSWRMFAPQLLGGKLYHPINKMIFLNEAAGWAVGGIQRSMGYPSISSGYILKWEGTQRPDISSTSPIAQFDTLVCDDYTDLAVEIVNSGTGVLTIPPGGVTFSHPEFRLVNTTLPLTIPDRSSRALTVRWQPPPNHYGPTPQNATMSIESSDTEHSPWRIALLGEHRVSRMMSSSVLTFPDACVGDSVIAVLYTSTFGNHPPTLLRVDASELRLLNHGMDELLSMNDSLVFSFRSDRPGAYSGFIQLHVGDPTCPERHDVHYSGTMHSNTLKPDPAVFDFGPLCTGDSATAWVQFENIGTQDARLLSVTRILGDSSFSINADTLELLATGERVLVPVSFSPKNVDSLSSTTIYRIITGPCLDTTDIVMRGRAMASLLTLDPESELRMGPLPLGMVGRRTVHIDNIGYHAVDILDVYVTPSIPGLQIDFPQTPFKVASRTPESISLAYTSSVAGTYTGNLRIIAGAPCPDTLDLHLELISDELPRIAAPDDFVFDTQTCIDPVVDSVRIDNIGQQALMVSAIELFGSDWTHFTVVGPTPPLVIPAGSHAFISMSYDRPANGGSSAFLRLLHNDKTVSTETLIRLNGRKRVQTLTLIGDTLTTLLGCEGEVATRSFVLRNDNPDPLHLVRLEMLSGSPYAWMTHPSIPRSIASMDSVTIEVHVQAPRNTLFDIVLRLTIDPCFEQRVLTIPAGVRPPLLTTAPSPVEFGTRSIHDTSEMEVTVSNEDETVVVVHNVILNGLSNSMYLTGMPQFPLSLAPDSSMSLLLALLAQKDSGAVAGTLCIIVSYPCPDTVCIDVSALFSQGALALSPPTLKHILAFCETERCDSVLVTNPLSKEQLVRLSVSPSDVFTLPPDLDEITLAPGDWAFVTICARLDGREQTSGLLVLDASEGYAQMPLLAVRDRGGIVLPDTVHAGNLPYCESSREIALLVGNDGLLPERIESASVNSASWELLTALPVEVPASGSVTLRLRFTPRYPGSVESDTLMLATRVRDCYRTFVTILHGTHATRFLDVSPSSVVFANVAVGTRQTKTLLLRNIDMPELRLSGILGEDEVFTTTLPVPTSVDTGTTLSVPITFEPRMVGTVFGEFCFVFDQPCADTICVAIEGMGIEGALRFDAAALDFDTLAQCEQQTLSAILTNTGSTVVTLHSSDIDGPGVSAFTLLNPIAADETILPGSHREFLIRFAPDRMPDGAVRASLFVGSDAPMQGMVELPLQGYRMTQATIPPIVVPLGVVLYGARVEQPVMIMNSGSASLRIDGFTYPPNIDVVTPLPLALPAGRSTSVRFSFAPPQPGAFRDTVFALLRPCDEPLLIIFEGIAVQRFVLNDLDFGDVLFCQDADGIITLRNNSAETVRIDSMRIAGAHASRFTLLAPPALPLNLHDNEEFSLTLRCIPDANDRGWLNAVLLVYVIIEGEPAVFTATLRAHSISGTPRLPDFIDLGQAPLGSPTQAYTLILRNPYAWPSYLERLTGSSRLNVQAVAPASIAAFDSMSVTLTMIPNAPGVLVDTLLLHYTAPCDVTDTLIITGEGVGSVFPLSATVPDYIGAPDDTVDIAILLDRSISVFETSDWSGTLAFDASMLYPLAVVSEGTISRRMHVQWSYDGRTGEVHIEALGAPDTEEHETLIFVRCLVLVGGAVETPLTLRNMRFHHPVFSLERKEAGRFLLDAYCLDDGSRLLTNRAGYWIGAISPNPASDRVVIPFGIGRDGRATLHLYDAGGREVATLLDETFASGEHRRIIGLPRVPTGSYRIVLSSGDRTLAIPLLILR